MLRILTIVICTVIFGCRAKPPSDGSTVEARAVEDQPDMGLSLCSENFSAFFDRFKSDTLYQRSRIENPISVSRESYEGTAEKELITVNTVGFSDAEWEGKVSLVTRFVGSDTASVVLQVLDTGVYFEHYFICRNNSWYLVEIVDSST